ncbi:MAG: hypothetical protein DRJ67_09155 [Thermoprotei archaeon]|nr:MAG: hypothetical protein DRJ67_09155 [Thermoprotei archaeon]
MVRKYVVKLLAGEEPGDETEILYAEFEDEWAMCNWLHSLLSALRTGRLEGAVTLEIMIREVEE